MILKHKNTRKFQTLKLILILILSVTTVPMGTSAQAQAQTIAEKDLAIVLSSESRALISAHTSPKLFPKAWYESMLKAYAKTPAGGAIETENMFEDWKLVSARLVPCAPLGLMPKHTPDTLCWPEVRVVWQPILRNVPMFGRILPAFADDRAVHALFDVDPAALGLSGPDATRARTLIGKVRSTLSAHPGTLAPLTSEETTEFVRLRTAAARAFAASLLGLRAQGLPQRAFERIGLRPEATTTLEDEKAFQARFAAFLVRHAPASQIRELTGFSLPEGRQPALLDEWVFIAFKGVNGALVPENIALRSAQNGRVLVNLGPSTVATQRRDDEKIYDYLAENPGTPDEAEIEASTLLLATDRDAIGGVIADRAQRLVPNVTCGSCHKLNAIAFDFHNLSFLEDRGMTVSPRVVKDVEHDLAWLRKAGLVTSSRR